MTNNNDKKRLLNKLKIKYLIEKITLKSITEVALKKYRYKYIIRLLNIVNKAYPPIASSSEKVLLHIFSNISKPTKDGKK